MTQNESNVQQFLSISSYFVFSASTFCNLNYRDPTSYQSIGFTVSITHSILISLPRRCGSSAIPFSLICTIELALTIGAITTIDWITETVLIPSLDPQVSSSSVGRWDVKAVGDLLDRECVRPDVILAEGDEDSDDEDDDTVLLQWDKNEDDVVADVESGGIVAEEELQLLNKPNHVMNVQRREDGVL
ncbi:hypothetical protein YC2023_066707 [Brassica napus]